MSSGQVPAGYIKGIVVLGLALIFICFSLEISTVRRKEFVKGSNARSVGFNEFVQPQHGLQEKKNSIKAGESVKRESNTYPNPNSESKMNVAGKSETAKKSIPSQTSNNLNAASKPVEEESSAAQSEISSLKPGQKMDAGGPGKIPGEVVESQPKLISTPNLGRNASHVSNLQSRIKAARNASDSAAKSKSSQNSERNVTHDTSGIKTAQTGRDSVKNTENKEIPKSTVNEDLGMKVGKDRFMQLYEDPILQQTNGLEVSSVKIMH